MTFLFDPLWGIASDRVGRKPLQLLACVGYVIGFGALATCRSIPLLLAGRAIQGATSCMLPICQASVRDISTPADLARDLGTLQGVAIAVALLVGGVAGGLLSSLSGPRVNFAVAAVVAASVGLVLAVGAPETLRLSRRAPRVEWERGNPVSSCQRLGADPTAFGATAAYLLFWVGLHGLQANLYNYASLRYGWRPVGAIALQACAGVVIAAANGLGPRLLAPRIGERNVVRASLLLFALCLAAMGVSPDGSSFAASVLFSSLATACLPCLTAMVAREAHEGEAGAALSALDQLAAADRLLAIQLTSKLFAWGILNGQLGLHFYVGAGCVVSGWAAFEVAGFCARRRGSNDAPSPSPRAGAPPATEVAGPPEASSQPSAASVSPRLTSEQEPSSQRKASVSDRESESD